MRLVHDEKRTRRDSTQEVAALGLAALDAVHLVIGREHDVWRRLAVGDCAHGVGRLGDALRRRECAALFGYRLSGLFRLVALRNPFKSGVVERNARIGIGHRHVDRATELFVPSNVVKIAPHVAVEVRLFGDEDRNQAVPLGVGDHRGDDAAFAYAGLVADDEAFALLDIRDA